MIMTVEQTIVNGIMNIAYVLGGVAALWSFLTAFLIIRMLRLEKQIKLLTSTIEANMYKKDKVL